VRNVIEIAVIVLLIVAMICILVRHVRAGAEGGKPTELLAMVSLGLSVICIIARRIGS
jgi:hypothetical protein